MPTALGAADAASYEDSSTRFVTPAAENARALVRRFIKQSAILADGPSAGSTVDYFVGETRVSGSVLIGNTADDGVPVRLYVSADAGVTWDPWDGAGGAGGGGLTDAELRASPVDVLVTNFPATQTVSGTVSISGTVPVSGARPDLGSTGYDGATLGTNQVTITPSGTIPATTYTIPANPNRKYLSIQWYAYGTTLPIAHFIPGSPLSEPAPLVYLFGSGIAGPLSGNIFTGAMFYGETLEVPEGYTGPVEFSTEMIAASVTVSLYITEF